MDNKEIAKKFTNRINNLLARLCVKYENKWTPETCGYVSDMLGDFEFMADSKGYLLVTNKKDPAPLGPLASGYTDNLSEDEVIDMLVTLIDDCVFNYVPDNDTKTKWAEDFINKIKDKALNDVSATLNSNWEVTINPAK